MTIFDLIMILILIGKILSPFIAIIDVSLISW